MTLFTKIEYPASAAAGTTVDGAAFIEATRADIIAAAEEMGLFVGEWVSVEDRLPEKSKKYDLLYLISDCDGDIDVYHYDREVWRAWQITDWMDAPTSTKGAE